jgi:hypothetical protein
VLVSHDALYDVSDAVSDAESVESWHRHWAHYLHYGKSTYEENIVGHLTVDSETEG